MDAVLTIGRHRRSCALRLQRVMVRADWFILVQFNLSAVANERPPGVLTGDGCIMALNIAVISLYSIIHYSEFGHNPCDSAFYHCNDVDPLDIY